MDRTFSSLSLEISYVLCDRESSFIRGLVRVLGWEVGTVDACTNNVQPICVVYHPLDLVVTTPASLHTMMPRAYTCVRMQARNNSLQNLHKHGDELDEDRSHYEDECAHDRAFGKRERRQILQFICDAPYH